MVNLYIPVSSVKPKALFDTCCFISVRKNLLDQNEYDPIDIDWFLNGIIKNANILTKHKEVNWFVNKILKNSDSVADSWLLAYTALENAKMFTFDKAMAIQARAHHIPVKEFKFPKQALIELRNVENKYTLLIPKWPQFYEFKKYGFGV